MDRAALDSFNAQASKARSELFGVGAVYDEATPVTLQFAGARSWREFEAGPLTEHRSARARLPRSLGVAPEKSKIITLTADPARSVSASRFVIEEVIDNPACPEFVLELRQLL